MIFHSGSFGVSDIAATTAVLCNKQPKRTSRHIDRGGSKYWYVRWLETSACGWCFWLVVSCIQTWSMLHSKLCKKVFWVTSTFTTFVGSVLMRAQQLCFEYSVDMSN